MKSLGNSQVCLARLWSFGTAKFLWTTAFSATFAGFLLISGRVSDIYSSSEYLVEMFPPIDGVDQCSEYLEWTFIAGAFCAGMLSLGSGLIHDKVGQFVLRALTGTYRSFVPACFDVITSVLFTGIAGAMTVPSALSLIIEWYAHVSISEDDLVFDCQRRFPEKDEQEQAIALFGGSSGLGSGEREARSKRSFG